MSEHVPRRVCALLYLASHTPQADAGEALRLAHAVKASFRLELDAIRRGKRPPGELAGPNLRERSASQEFDQVVLRGQPGIFCPGPVPSSGGEATRSRTTRPRRTASAPSSEATPTPKMRQWRRESRPRTSKPYWATSPRGPPTAPWASPIGPRPLSPAACRAGKARCSRCSQPCGVPQPSRCGPSRKCNGSPGRLQIIRVNAPRCIATCVRVRRPIRHPWRKRAVARQLQFLVKEHAPSAPQPLLAMPPVPVPAEQSTPAQLADPLPLPVPPASPVPCLPLSRCRGERWATRRSPGGCGRAMQDVLTRRRYLEPGRARYLKPSIYTGRPRPEDPRSPGDAQAPAGSACGVSVEEEIKRTLDGVDAKKAATNRNAPKKRPAASTTPGEPGPQPLPFRHSEKVSLPRGRAPSQI